jgi:hypothetical protein
VILATLGSENSANKKSGKNVFASRNASFVLLYVSSSLTVPSS